MVQRKKIRTRGKIQLSRYFQSLNEGDNVSIVKNVSIASSFPDRLQGRTGTVVEKRGRAYVVKIMDHDKEKKFIIEPIHLKRMTG